MAPNKHTFHRPAWIFFDLDDTLWDFSKNSQKSLLHVFEKYDTIRSVFSCYSEFEDEYHLHNARLWREFAQGRVSTPVLKSERWRLTLFPDSDPSDPPAVCREIDTEYLRFLACQPYTVEGAIPMLSRLSKRFMIGAISNGFKDTQYRKLSNSGLGRYISRIYKRRGRHSEARCRNICIYRERDRSHRHSPHGRRQCRQRYSWRAGRRMEGYMVQPHRKSLPLYGRATGSERYRPIPLFRHSCLHERGRGDYQ